jgi:hypothetical protein
MPTNDRLEARVEPHLRWARNAIDADKWRMGEKNFASNFPVKTMGLENVGGLLG